MAKDVPLGMEFMNWQNLPSLTQTLAGGKSPLLNTIGILLAGGDSSQPTVPEAAAPPPVPGFDGQAMGQGIAPPMGGTGQPGLQPNMGAPGMSPGNFLKAPTLPEIKPLGKEAPDYTKQVNSFWGV